VDQLVEVAGCAAVDRLADVADPRASDGKGKDASSKGNSGKNWSGNSKSASYGSSADGGSKGRSAFTKSEHASKVSKAAKAPPARKAAVEEVAKNQHGTIASTLKGLNAAHASLNAYANASPNSRVGMIATYRAALLEERAALDGQTVFLDALNGFATEEATASPEDVLAALQTLNAEGAAFTDEDVYAALAALNPDATEEELADLYSGLEGVVEAGARTRTRPWPPIRGPPGWPMRRRPGWRDAAGSERRGPRARAPPRSASGPRRAP
jgi:hypothetical protein